MIARRFVFSGSTLVLFGFRRARALALLVAAAACSGEAAEPARSGAGEATVARIDAPVPDDRAGEVVFGDERHSFLVLQCDSGDGEDTSLAVHGTGTASDGRRISVDVERAESGAFLTESATVVFGGIAEGDLWTASRTRWPDGRWFEIEEEGTPADGPLIRQDGSAIALEAEFERASDGSRRAGSLQAACPE